MLIKIYLDDIPSKLWHNAHNIINRIATNINVSMTFDMIYVDGRPYMLINVSRDIDVNLFTHTFKKELIESKMKINAEDFGVVYCLAADGPYEHVYYGWSQLNSFDYKKFLWFQITYSNKHFWLLGNTDLKLSDLLMQTVYDFTGINIIKNKHDKHMVISVELLTVIYKHIINKYRSIMSQILLKY